MAVPRDLRAQNYLREKLRCALARGERTGVKELDEMTDDVVEIVAAERDYYFRWARHEDACGGALNCSCGLEKAIAGRKKI